MNILRNLFQLFIPITIYKRIMIATRRQDPMATVRLRLDVCASILAGVVLQSVNSGNAAITNASADPITAAETAWHLGTLENVIVGSSPLRVRGDVRTGVALSTAEQASSLQRGGDGQVAIFQGGYLETDGEHCLANITGKSLTLCARFRTTQSDRGVALVGWKTKGDRYAGRLFIDVKASKASLVAELATDAKSQPLQLSAPMDALGATAWHDVVLRYQGYRVELFVDGVLVDEEWPMGSLLMAAGPFTIGSEKPAESFHGAVDHVVLWKRALTDEEILRISGDRESLTERELRFLGAETPPGQYWRPRGFNVNVGDCMPFYQNGEFHLYYLFDRRHHRSKWGLGAHQWAHVSTTDLRNWKHHPMAVPISHEMEGSICTGSTFFHDGIYYAFYAVRMANGSPAELCAATSKDGVNFTKNPPLATLKAPYNSKSARDPVVFRDPNTGLFHMLLTTELVNPTIAGRGGCLAQLVSKDLRHWEQRDPFIVPGYPGQPECPDYFFWNGWYYLVFSNNGVARYRISHSPLGPWQRPKIDVFDGPQAMVMKTAVFTGNRRLGAAFMRDGGYGGHLIFREIFQHPDGTLGTKWPVEVVPGVGAAVSVEPQPLTSGVSRHAENIRLNRQDGLTVALLADRGVARLDGAMVDIAHKRIAQRLLARAAALEGRG